MFSRFYFLAAVFFILLFVSNSQAATYVVDRTDDVAGASACTAAPNDCSLRGAINNANANGAGADVIQFNLSQSGLPQTINLVQELPEIQTSLTIDGTSEPLWNNSPLVEINGASAGANTSGFTFNSPNNNAFLTVVVKGLAINRFSNHGIVFSCESGVNATLTGSYIGTNPTGTIAQGNGNDGVLIFAFPSSSFSVGGTANGQRNIISGNGGDGVDIETAISLTPANTSVSLVNNYIGVNAAGNAMGNDNAGISVAQILVGTPNLGYSVFVGGALAAQRNIVSGNKVGIDAETADLFVYNNYIGTNPAGTAAVPNALQGVHLTVAVNAVIGGTPNGFPAGNVISGNQQNGILIDTVISLTASIKRNLIGTNAAGTAALANNWSGIYLYESNPSAPGSIVIGSDTFAADGNTISGNDGFGIKINKDAPGAKIYGNRIGTNAAATAAVPNDEGILILSADNDIGADGNAIAANVISGNNTRGVGISNSDATGNKVYGNYIGTNANGANLGNGDNGIDILQGASGNFIGSGSASGGNTIAYNGGIGVAVYAGTSNSIRGNSIYSNNTLGIDLQGNFVTVNDPGDTDTGPNNLQNYPVFVNASPSQIAGTLNSTPNKPFTIDFYRVDSCDATGNGEGKYFLGSKNLIVPNSGTGFFNYLDIPLTVGQIVTATATDENGNTSEFSPCYTVNPPPGTLSFSAANYTANEGGGKKTIVVNRTGGSFGTIQVNYATSDGTATAGQDYAATSGTLTFFNGEVTKTFDVSLNDDALNETSETINLTLSFPTNGSYLTTPNKAVLTIQDNDALPTFSIDDVSQAEGNAGTTQFTFHVTLSAPSGQPTAIDYTTANGTATASSDYAATGGHIDFAPGETTKPIVVSVLGDLTPELDETFFVNITATTNAGFGDAQGQGTILDDDNPGKLSFGAAQYSGAENQTVTITVRRSNGTTGTVTVDYATNGGTATPGTDYTPVSGTLIFGDGEIQKTFDVNILDDNIAEPMETVNLMLSNPIGGATLGAQSSAVLNITDNDSGVNVSVVGSISYGTSPQPQIVPNTLLKAAGTNADSAFSDQSGFYVLGNLFQGGNYTVTPSKTGDVNGITAFDATLVLRHVAAGGQGANALSVNQQKAADTNNDALVTAFDATQILRFVAANGANATTGQVGEWKFLSPTHNYNPLNNSLNSQDFAAFLIGEVSGDWTPPANPLAEMDTTAANEAETQNRLNAGLEVKPTRQPLIDARIAPLSEAVGAKDGTILIPIRLTNYAGKIISGYSFEVRFDADALEPDAERPFEQNETLSRDFAVACDTSQPGRIGIAAASSDANRSYPAAEEVLLYLRFKIKEAVTETNGENAGLTFPQQPVFEDENGNRIFVKTVKYEQKTN